MSKRQPKDVQWPPLGVRDLKPETPAAREVVRFGTVRAKNLREL